MVVRFDPFDATVLEPCAGFGATAAPATSGREGARNDVPGDRTGFDAPDASTDAGSAATGAGSCGTSGGVVGAAVSAVTADSVEWFADAGDCSAETVSVAAAFATFPGDETLGVEFVSRGDAAGATDRAAGSGAAGAGPRNDETRSCTRSANGCAGSPRNDGAASAHAATIPDASTLVRHRNDWRAAGGAMRVGGTAGEISTRGRRITAVGAVSGTTCGGGRLPPVARRTGAMRVSGVIGVEPSTTVASRRTVQPVTTESARSRSRMRAPVTSISS